MYSNFRIDHIQKYYKYVFDFIKSKTNKIIYIYCLYVINVKYIFLNCVVSRIKDMNVLFI